MASPSLASYFSETELRQAAPRSYHYREDVTLSSGSRGSILRSNSWGASYLPIYREVEVVAHLIDGINRFAQWVFDEINDDERELYALQAKAHLKDGLINLTFSALLPGIAFGYWYC